MLVSSLWAGTNIEMLGAISEERISQCFSARTSRRYRRISRDADTYKTR